MIPYALNGNMYQFGRYMRKHIRQHGHNPVKTVSSVQYSIDLPKGETVGSVEADKATVHVDMLISVFSNFASAISERRAECTLATLSEQPLIVQQDEMTYVMTDAPCLQMEVHSPTIYAASRYPLRMAAVSRKHVWAIGRAQTLPSIAVQVKKSLSNASRLSETDWHSITLSG